MVAIWSKSSPVRVAPTGVRCTSATGVSVSIVDCSGQSFTGYLRSPSKPGWPSIGLLSARGSTAISRWCLPADVADATKRQPGDRSRRADLQHRYGAPPSSGRRACAFTSGGKGQDRHSFGSPAGAYLLSTPATMIRIQYWCEWFAFDL